MDCLYSPHSDPTKREEYLRPHVLSALGNNEHLGVSDYDEASGEESHSQTEADELWDALKAETGYASYGDYLEAYSAEYPDLDSVMRRSMAPHLDVFRRQWSKFTILDLSKDENTRPRVVQRCYSESATSIVTSLRQPPAGVAAQILLWNTTDYCNRHEVNALGLGLRISPRLYEALYDGYRPSGSKHIRIGGAVATVVHHYKPDKPDAIPVVIITSMILNSTIANAVQEEVDDIFPFQYPAVKTYPFHINPSNSEESKRMCGRMYVEHPTYLRLLKWVLEKEKAPALDVSGLTLRSLIPLLYLSIFAMRDLCENIRKDYRELQRVVDLEYGELEGSKERITSALVRKRLRLRALVEDSEDDLNRLPGYIRSETSAGRQLDDSWIEVEEELKRTHQEARRLEAQIRDYLQLQVGEWALQESKRSIELSSRQIEEGKRVKIFTILAFIYVPLNLATSIFGMNLRELNGSGRSLWVFFTTAIIALLTTGTFWWLLE